MDSLPIKVEEVLRKTFPNVQFRQDQLVAGDLNQDSLHDFAVLIFIPRATDDAADEQKIAVFFGKLDGSYQLYALSQDVFPHERVDAELEVKKRSLFLHRRGSGGCCSHWSESFQFKMRENDLVLIGTEFGEFSSGDAVNDHGISANYLTSEAVIWSRVGKKRKESRVKTPKLELLKLPDFNYSTYTNFIPKEAQQNW